MILFHFHRYETLVGNLGVCDELEKEIVKTYFKV
jgi:hypothetical protein